MGIFQRNKKTVTFAATTTTVVVAGGIAALIVMGSGIELVELSITPHKGAGSVDVTEFDGFVTCAMTLTDTDGVKHAVCALASPTSSQTSSCIATTPSSGTVNNGVWTCNVRVPTNSEPGEWFVQYLSVTDLATPDSNTETVVKSEIEADVCPSGCVITSTDQLLIPVTSPNYDNLPPNVLNFVATTNPVPLRAAGGTVTCDPSITDLPEIGQSGLNDHTCTLTSPDGTVQHSCRGALANPCDVTMSATLEEGVWPIYITARDNAGNSRTYPSDSIPGTQSITVSGAGGTGGTGGTGGAGGVSCDLPVDLTVASGWAEQDAGDPAGADLTFTSYVRVSGSHGYVAVSDEAMTGHSAMAMGVRFEPSSGFFDARDGTDYGCGTGDGDGGDTACDIPWVADTWYQIVMIADVAAETYTVQVGECDSPLEPLIVNASFRNFGTNGLMTHYNVWGDTGITTDLSGAIWNAGACVPLTCADYGPNACGTPSDGCVGTLDCDAVLGTCDARQSGDVCDSQFQCCMPLTFAQVCGGQGGGTIHECDSWSDGCNSTIDCGTCTGGDICLSGECVDPGTALEPENTQGDSWETIYENCTNDAYPVGYRPPLYVRPTMQNTGVNCPNKASGCPADATLTPLGTNSINTPGLYENFTVTGALNIEASNVTIRNFEILCNGSVGLDVDTSVVGTLIEYGTIKKAPGADECGWAIWPMGAETHVRHVHMDQCGQDCIQSTQVPGPIMIERSLFTRPGDNGGYGSNAHADTWQYYNNTLDQHACWIGSRVVPSYCPNFYKNSNVTQSGWNATEGATAKWYLYNNWFDSSTNVMLAGDGGIVRNNKFGNWVSGGGYWFDPPNNITNMGGNTFECDGSPLTNGQQNSVQSTCAWGFDNDPVIGWDGESECGSGGEPCDGEGNPIHCTGTVNSQPIDPTEFCTSDGSGCIVSPIP